MQRRLVLATGPFLLLRPAWALSLTEGDANAGIRTALERGANSAVALLGRPDGFLGNPLVKIELPGHLKDAARLLRAAGQGAKLDELVTAMNRAAEAAVPAAKPLLVVPPSLEGAARGIVASALVNGGETNKWANTAEPMVVPWLA